MTGAGVVAVVDPLLRIKEFQMSYGYRVDLKRKRSYNFKLIKSFKVQKQTNGQLNGRPDPRESALQYNVASIDLWNVQRHELHSRMGKSAGWFDISNEFKYTSTECEHTYVEA